MTLGIILEQLYFRRISMTLGIILEQLYFFRFVYFMHFDYIAQSNEN